MFTPIKNLITYIQKNASNNSIFGGNSTTEESNKMEIENSKMATEAECKIPKENEPNEIIPDIDKKELEEVEVDEKAVKVEEEEDKKENEEKEKEKDQDQEECKEQPNDKEPIDDKQPSDDTQLTDNKDNIERTDKQIDDTESKKITVTVTSTVSAENSCEFEDEDIEAQIGSSIMLKKPVKVASTNGSEILEVKKSSNANCSIVITHDVNRNQAIIPIDDELEDFRHDPTEILGSTSSPASNQHQHAEEFCSVGSAEEASERDKTLAEDIPTEEEEEDYFIEIEDDQKTCDETDQEEEKDTETEAEAGHKNSIIIDDDDDDEETFLDLDDYKSSNVIVLDEVDLNASTASLDTINTNDDPLAIACEEQEAFAADKVAALEELHLLNSTHTSQDDDTRTTTEDDLQWLRTDLDDPQPSCSKVMLTENGSNVTPEKEERNGEGSDSGLGSETSALHTTLTSITDTSQLNTTSSQLTPAQTPTQIKTKDNESDSEKMLNLNVLKQPKSPPKDLTQPQRSNLKRRLEVEDVVDGLDNIASTAASSLSDRNIQKKPKRSINFDTVQVYYFPRQQGFSCVPSAGGCTLGMSARHVAFKTLTLAEHAAELRRAHRMQLQEINPRGSSSDDSEESEEDYLSEGSGSDLDGESNGFLQPVSPKQRRALLKAAGIRKIDPSEKAECRNIRNSREICGCTCRDFCDPETCACSQSGIKCQVDRDMFPCGCSRDACGNTIGRVEFNPARVRTHFIHTLMRLEMENRQQQNPYSSAIASPSPMQPTPPVSYYQTHLQPQSNYSSGYASPAYNTAPELHQQTAASAYYHPTPPSSTNGLYGQQNSLEMTHNGSAANTNTTSQYGMDSLDTSLFGASSTATPSYGELMPVTSYHYGNVQTQASTYYHNNSPYINPTNIATPTALNTPNAYSSCAVPSIPPYGTATTTEATGVYHSVSSLTSMETTTAPSCSISGTAPLDNDVGASFISLSTPLASSSRLSQINDLLQHNRNATTALVAISQDIRNRDSNLNLKSTYETQVMNGNTNTLQSTVANSSSGAAATASSFSIDTPPIEDANKTCLVYEQLEPPLKPAPIVGVFEVEEEKTKATIPAATSSCAEVTQNKIEESTITTTPSSPTTINSEFLSSPTTGLCKDEKDIAATTVNAPIEPPTAIEVAAGK